MTVDTCKMIIFVVFNVNTIHMYLLRHRREYTTGIIERGCGRRETNKARGVAECLIRSRDHIRVQ